MKFVIMMALVLGVHGCLVKQVQKSAKDTPVMKVALGRDIRSVSGFTWWLDSQGRYRDFTLLDGCEIDVQVPSGRNLHYSILNASLHQEKGYVSRVYMRLPQSTININQAITNLEAELAKLDPTILDGCSRDISRLRNIESDPRRASTGEYVVCNYVLEGNTHLKAGIKTVDFVNGTGFSTKWITFLEFSL
ncbi:MAG: hypothetical protein MSG64_18945 [Pyrinomonadaceae bacterium MAG19_C2-C3]|nr:hypothetical protein [Pyrinomonadaceae bacterium MAG19_C2-C3]